MATEPRLALSVGAGGWPAKADLQALAKNAVAATKSALTAFPGDAEISVHFTDDAAIAELNGRWRHKPQPTNVLSFPAPSLGFGGDRSLGDIVLAFETVTKEAAEADLTLADHISHLLVHGLLHLVGFDHEDDEEAEAMERLETTILAKLGIANPYAGSEPELTIAGKRNGQ